jgi:protein-tyrosine phosphatase
LNASWGCEYAKVERLKEIFWISEKLPPHLAIVLRPQGGDQLEEELLRMKRHGIDTVVSMLEPGEAEMLGLENEKSIAERLGLKFLSFPIGDRKTPPELPAFRSFVAGLADRLGAGERIGVHCRGSIGRSTVSAACALIHMGWEARAALAAIEAARGYPVPDTPQQQDWILRYEVR